MKRIRVRKRILVGELAVERELLDVLHRHLQRLARPAAVPVAAAIDEDAREPRRRGGVVLELSELAVGVEQAVLDSVLGILADQAAGKPVEGRQLRLHQLAEAPPSRIGQIGLVRARTIHGHKTLPRATLLH